jgi:alpha-tubulin suppressor-like RCC1 family protein
MKRLTVGGIVTPLLLSCIWSCKDGSGPSGATTIARVSGSGQSGNVAQVLPLPLTVRVTNQSGSGVPGVRVVFAVTAGGGQLSASEAVTDASGEAAVSWVLGTTAGTNNNSATATVAGLSGSPVTFTASALAGAVADIDLVAGDFQQGAVTLKLPDSVVALVTDGWGNPIAGTRIVFSAVTYGSTFFPETAFTDSTGRARTAWRLGETPGLYTLEVKPALAALPTAPATAYAIQVTALASGEDHSCALIDTGENVIQGQPYCWGKNDHFQLGDVTNTNRNVPTRVTYGLPFTSLAVGNDYSCGLSHGNTAYCWGSNAAGQLGDGTTTERVDPTPVQGGLEFQMLVAGSHTCGLTPNGDLYCWGKNGRGQLGDSTNTDRWIPTPVAGGHKFRYVTVSHGPVTSGDGHTCALTDVGLALCWGANTDGQLGDGTNDDSPFPVAVNADTTSYNEISAGTSHTCSLAWTVVYCWGSNANGQFGNGGVTGNPAAPVQGGGTNIVYGTVSAGAFYTCATEPSRSAVCWGDNASGQLGDSSTTERHSPVLVGGGYGYSRVAPARSHACGLTTAGVVYCWGANEVGQVGDGTSTNRLTPVPISWRFPPP